MTILGALMGTCGLVVGLAAIGGAAEPTSGGSGVLPGAQVPAETVDALRARHLLPPGDPVLVYHEAATSSATSEITLVTPGRVVYARGDRVDAIELADVTSITHRNEDVAGDIVEITADDGRRMRVQIAPLTGGHGYVNVLEDAWRKHRPEARIND